MSNRRTFWIDSTAVARLRCALKLVSGVFAALHDGNTRASARDDGVFIILDVYLLHTKDFVVVNAKGHGPQFAISYNHVTHMISLYGWMNAATILGLNLSLVGTLVGSTHGGIT